MDGQEAKELPLGDDDDDVYLGRRWFLGGSLMMMFSLRDNVDTSVTLKERLTSRLREAWTRGRGEAIS